NTRPADAEALADQVEQAAATGRAESGSHLLDDGQRDRQQHEHPQQLIAVPGADGADRADATSIVAGHGRDDAGAEDRQPAQLARRRATQAAQLDASAANVEAEPGPDRSRTSWKGWSRLRCSLHYLSAHEHSRGACCRHVGGATSHPTTGSSICLPRASRQMTRVTAG